MKTTHAVRVVLTLSSLIALVGPTLASAASPSPVNLGSAANFVILAKTGISTTGSTSVTGDIGLSPAAASYITGFALTLPAAGSFSTSALVSGKVYAPGYANPTSATLTTAVLDMQNAYTDAMGRAPDVTELGAGNIGGLTIAPGVYKWDTGVTVPVDVTLSGDANSVWIFQVAQDLVLSSGAKIVLSGGAKAGNIFWAVSGQTTIGTSAVFNGNVLDQTAIVLNTGAQFNGRTLSQTAVTLDGNAVTMPSSSGQSNATVQSSVTTSNQNQNQAQSNSQPQPQPQAQTAVSGIDPTIALRAQLNGLAAVLQTLQLAQQQGTPLGQSVRQIATNLTQGSTGTNVAILQRFLIERNTGSSSRALAHVGATAYFGTLTRAALAEFQAQTGITPALGYFGSITRAYVSTHY